MIEITLPNSIADLCRSCETLCEKECCGISAFNFSPFNMIYHLTRIHAQIFEEDVAEIRAELAEFLADLGRSDQHAEKVIISEFNAILTIEQVISLFGEIDSALSEGCAIYALHETRIDKISQNIERIVEVSK